MYRRLCFRRAIVVVTGWMEVVEETKDVVEGIGRVAKMGIMVHIASYQHETNAITTHIRRQEEEKIEQIIVREKLEKSRKNLTSNPYHLLQKRTVSTTSCNSLHGEGDTVPGVRESITCTGHDILHTINQSQFVHRRRQHNRS